MTRHDIAEENRRTLYFHARRLINSDPAHVRKVAAQTNNPWLEKTRALLQTQPYFTNMVKGQDPEYS